MGTVLKVKTVHKYNFKNVEEYVIYDDFDYLYDEGQTKKLPTGRVGRTASNVGSRDRGIVISRAKKTLRRLALYNQMDRLLTITTRENITDFEKLDKLFKKFVFRLRQIYPDFKYIGTRERQNRGAVHYHLLINRYIPHKTANEIWNKLLKTGGTVNITRSKNGVDIRGINAINYLIKYVGKAMEDNTFINKKGFSSKAYLCSQLLDRNYKLSRQVIRFYIQIQQDYEEFKNFMEELNQKIKSKTTRLIFDKKFEFEMNLDKCFGRNILIQT